MIFEDRSKAFSACEIGAFSGAVTDLSNKDYHSLHKYWSSTDLKFMFSNSPLHFQFKYFPERKRDEPTPNMILGSAVHSLIHEPKNFDKEFYKTPKFDLRKTADKELKAELEKLNPGKTALNVELYDQAHAMRDSVYKNLEAKEMLDSAVHESSFFWTCPFSGLKLRSKVDGLIPGSLFIETKTTSSGKESDFVRHIFKMNYDLSLFHYSQGIEIVGGERLTASFIVVEVEPPYAAQVFTVSLENQFWDIGHRKWLDSVSKLSSSLSSGIWPGYSVDNSKKEIVPLGWMLKGDEDGV